MLNLVRADLFNLRKSRALKIVMGITTLCAIAMTVMAYLIPQGKLDERLVGIGFLFSDVSMISIVGAVIASAMICNDYDNKTLHDAVATGSSRGAIIVSKVIVMSCAIVVVLLPYAIATAIAIGSGSPFSMGSVAVGFLNMMTAEAGSILSAAEMWKLVGIMLTLIIVYMAQLSFCVLLAFVLKKPILVIAINYGFTAMCAQLIGLGDSSPQLGRIISWTPYAGQYAFMTLDTEAGMMIKAVGVSLLYVIVMIALTYSVFRRSELK